MKILENSAMLESNRLMKIPNTVAQTDVILTL